MKKVPKKYTRKYYNFLIRYARIIGCITPQDEILSITAHFEDAENHGDYFPNLLTARRWRWDWQSSLNSASRDSLDTGDWERVKDHLTNQYDIPFWENGHHDIDYITKKSNLK